MAFVMIDIYITKSIRIPEIWMLRKKIFFKMGTQKELA